MKIMFLYGGFENIGIEYLSAVLKLHGHSTRLAFDPMLFNDTFITIPFLHKYFNYENQVIHEINEYAPQVLAISIISPYYNWALRIARKVRFLLPSTHITCGGIHPSSIPEKILQSNVFNSAIIGEGEYAFLDLINSLQEQNQNKSIKNIWFKTNSHIIKNPLRPLIHNLDTLPFPDKELFYNTIPDYRKGYTIITRRGCINSCSYCHNAVIEKLYNKKTNIRLRSVDNVIEELKQSLCKYHFHRVRVNDDLFTYNKAWLKDFAYQYSKYINLPLYCFGSPDTIDEEVISYLKKVRCYQLCLGVQSLNQNLRKTVLNRHGTNDKIRESIQLCRKNKIRVVVDNIWGIPGETKDDLILMADFYNKNRPDRICVFGLIYFPTLPIIKSAKDHTLLDQEKIEEIENSPSEIANTICTPSKKKENIKLRWLLFFSFLPRKIFTFVLKKRLYNFSPPFNPHFLESFITIFTKDRLDIPRQRYYIRYGLYGTRIIKSKMAGLFKK